MTPVGAGNVGQALASGVQDHADDDEYLGPPPTDSRAKKHGESEFGGEPPGFRTPNPLIKSLRLGVV
jgi:hypothetical protein